MKATATPATPATWLDRERDTAFEGPGRQFPSTCWSRLRQWTEGGVLEELALRYWKPIYVFIRVRWAKSSEDARDLTQEFFAWMIGSDFLAKADPARGRFRSFVKVALRNWLVKEQDKSERIKRGGGRIVALEELLRDGSEVSVPAASDADPEHALDEAWRNELLGQTVKRLEEIYRAEGKEQYFRVFQDYHLAGEASTDYRAVAERCGITPKDVSNYLAHVKGRLRSVLIEQVSQTVDSREELEEELALLFGGATP